MVVMDGCFSVFKLILNSRNDDVPHEDLIPGTTVIIQPGDYKFIFMQDDDDSGFKRGALFVDNADWRASPQYDIEEEATTVTPDHYMVWLDTQCIDRCEKQNLFLYTSSYQHEEGFFYYMAMTVSKFREGKFAASLPEKMALWNQKKRSAPEVTVCECSREPFCFQSCITEREPLSGIDLQALFDQVHRKLQGRVKVVTFKELTASQKRWCHYWYYAVNYFHLGGCESQELPSCFVTSVREQYPDSNGQYTGFRTREEREEESLDKM